MLQRTPLPKTQKKKQKKQCLYKKKQRVPKKTNLQGHVPNFISRSTAEIRYQFFWVNKNWNHKVVDPHHLI